MPRKKCRTLYPALPTGNYRTDKFIFPPVYSMYVLTLPSKSAKGHAKNMGICLQKLLEAMGTSEMIFMGDNTLPWLYRNSDYTPAKEGVHYLITTGISASFNGGLVVPVAEIRIFIKHLFLLVRTNTILQCVYGVDRGQHLLINVCQYGGVHISLLSEETDRLFNESLPASNFQLREGNTCYSPWAKSSAIPGRTTIV